jgi:hypothetical protein
MNYALIILIWFVNFGISIWNAYAVGKAWVETKHAGGWARVIAWSGAVMSASGFSWCYLIVLAVVARGLGWIGDEHVLLTLQIGYVIIIPGVLVSGLMITLDSWARAYRTRAISDIGIAAWNTYAQIHNTFHAIKDLDKAFAAVVDAFGSSKGGSSSDKKGGAALIVVFVLVVVALLSGILTTAVIIARFAGEDDLPDTSYGPPAKKK